MNHRRFLAMLLLPFILLFAGCGGSGGGGSFNAQIITLTGGTFNFQESRVTLVVPANSINQTATITVQPTNNFPASNMVLNGTVFQLTSSPLGATFSPNHPTRIRIHFPQLAGADPTRYGIYQVEGQFWALHHSTVNVAQGYVEAEIDGMGTFGILVGPAGDTFRTVLGPGQETGAVVDPDINASGTATVFVPDDNSSITVRIQSQGLQNVTAAHIHVAAVGSAGPVAITLFRPAAPENDVWSNDYTITADASRLNLGTVPNIAALAQAIRENRAYVNVHTQANPAGAIRGQVGTNVTLEAHLTGSQEVPSNNSAGMGTATITLNQDMTEINVDMHVTDLTGVTAAHVHRAIAGSNGPIIFPLFTTGVWNDHLNVTLDAADIAAGTITFDEAINSLLSDGMYVNVHTQAVPAGEIRGQIGPVMP